MGARAGRRRQPHHQPAAAGADPRRRRRRGGQPPRRRAVGARVPVLPVGRGCSIVVIRVLFRVVFGGGVGEHVLFTLPEVPLPELGRRDPAVRAGHGRAAARRPLRRAAAGHDADLPRRRQRAGQPEAAAAVVPGALYEVGIAVVVALSRRAAAGRERRSGCAGPAGCAAAGSRGLRALRGDRHAGARGRARPLAARSPPRWTPAATAGRRRVAPRAAGSPAALVVAGLLGVCVGRLRPARRAPRRGPRRCRCSLAGLAVARGGSRSAAGGCAAPATDPTRGALAECAGRGAAGSPRRRCCIVTGRRRPGRPQPVAVPADLAGAAARAGRSASCSRRCRAWLPRRRRGRSPPTAAHRQPVDRSEAVA